MKNYTLETKLDQLPGSAKLEVLDFIEFLAQKYQKKRRRRKFKFDWAGGLAEWKTRFTAVELQHKASEWR